MCIGHIREGITIFSCRTTLAPRRPRPANSPRLSTTASDQPTASRNSPRHHPARSFTRHHLPPPPPSPFARVLSIFSSNLFSSLALLLQPAHPSRPPPPHPPLRFLSPSPPTVEQGEIELTWTRQFSIFPFPVGAMTFFFGLSTFRSTRPIRLTWKYRRRARAISRCRCHRFSRRCELFILLSSFSLSLSVSYNYATLR